MKSMKNLKQYLIESQNFLVNKKLKNRQDRYEYYPKTMTELVEIIMDLLKKGQTDLNCINVSKITNMSYLFAGINYDITVKDIDISDWDVSNVTAMHGMFCDCDEFNSDLSMWNVSYVEDMANMFYACKKFNSDLSNWNVFNAANMYNMFGACETLKKNNKIPKWYTGRV